MSDDPKPDEAPVALALVCIVIICWAAVAFHRAAEVWLP